MKRHFRCSVREPTRCAMSSSWPSRIFFSSYSLSITSVLLGTGWQELSMDSSGRTLRKVISRFRLALKSMLVIFLCWLSRGRDHPARMHRCHGVRPCVGARRSCHGPSCCYRRLAVLCCAVPAPAPCVPGHAAAMLCRCRARVHRSVDVAPSPPCEPPTSRVAVCL